MAPFRSLLTHCHTISIFVSRDIRGRYVNSALGLWWAVIQPLTLLASLHVRVLVRYARPPRRQRNGPENSPFTVSAACFRGWPWRMP